MLLLLMCSCRSAGDYRSEADKVGSAYLDAFQREAVGRTEEIEIETPADTLRRRLMLDQQLFANDPASYGIRDLPANRYWDARERLLPGGVDSSLPVWNGGTNALEIGLVDAVRIAAYNSTEYKAQQIEELKAQLSATDYKAIKYAEGWLSEEDFAPIKAERQAIRERINALESEI